MVRIKIKTQKQENGIWGKPLNCYKMSGIPPLHDEELHLLSSAIETTINEKHNTPYIIEYIDTGFFITLTENKFNGNRLILVEYNICLLEDDSVIYFDNVEEKNVYLRKHKIKKIMDGIK